MLDRHLRPLIDPPLNALGRAIAARGIGANEVTLAGLGMGLVAAALLAFGLPGGMALLPLLLGRLLDGLDGAVARLTQPTDRGAFLDITLDFLFYAAIPLGFAFADPTANALPAAVLLASFIGTGSSFLAFAIVAEKRQLQSLAFPDKSFYFLGGLTEATETIAAFVAMCLWPQWFAPIAYGFAALCAVTTALRIGWGYAAFR